MSAVQEVHPIEDAAEQAATTKSRWALRRRHLWVLAPLALIWSFQCLRAIEPFDFWWNEVSGKIMVQSGQFLGTDVLVFSPVREPYSNPQWIAQILFYLFYAASPALLIVLRAAIITATFGILFAICYRVTRSLGWSATATMIAFITGLTNYGMRPQLFAFLPFVLFYWLLDNEEAHPRRLWLLIPTMIFWVNVHGSYFLGWALLGIYAVAMLPRIVGELRGKTLRVADYISRLVPMALGALAAFVNPYGLGIIAYFFAATGDQTARNLNVEWQPPTLYNGTGILFFSNLAIFIVTLFLSRRSLSLKEALLLGAFGFLSLLSIRNVIWWAWLSAPLLALNCTVLARRIGERRGLAQNPPSQAADIPLFNWIIAGVLVLAMIATLPFFRPASQALDKTTPIALTDALAATPTANRIFNYMEWGGYMEAQLYPQQQMFIDGRFEARQQQVWADYLAISDASYDWQQRLDRYNIKTLALNNSFHDALIPAVRASPRWQQVYSDDQGAIFVAK